MSEGCLVGLTVSQLSFTLEKKKEKGDFGKIQLEFSSHLPPNGDVESLGFKYAIDPAC